RSKNETVLLSGLTTARTLSSAEIARGCDESGPEKRFAFSAWITQGAAATDSPITIAGIASLLQPGLGSLTVRVRFNFINYLSLCVLLRYAAAVQLATPRHR